MKIDERASLLLSFMNGTTPHSFPEQEICGLAHLSNIHPIPYILHDFGERRRPSALPPEPLDAHAAIRALGKQMFRDIPILCLFPLEENEIAFEAYNVSKRFKKKIFAEFQASCFFQKAQKIVFRSVLVESVVEKLRNVSGYTKRVIKK